MANIKVNQDILDTENTLFSEAQKAIVKGANTTIEGDNVIYQVRSEKLDIPTAKYVVSKGGDILDFPLFIEVNLTDNVPTGFVGSTFKDEDGNDVVNTWSSWLAPNNTPLVTGGRTFVATNGHTSTNLNMSELVPVFDKLVHVNEIKSLQDQENTIM